MTETPLAKLQRLGQEFDADLSLALERRLADLEARVAGMAALEVRIKCLEQLLAEPDDDEFSVFWKAYPRKVAVAAARKAYKAARKKAALDVILAGLERYKVEKPSEHPWKHASTWLNGECWADNYTDRQDSPGSAGGGDLLSCVLPKDSNYTRAAVDALASVLLGNELERHRMAGQIRNAYAGDKPDQHDRNILWVCGRWYESGVLINMTSDAKQRAMALWRQAIMDKAASLDIGKERFAWPAIN